MGEVVAQRREDVINVAIELFARRGFQATSIRDIAEVLGLKAGSLYSHIASKDDLLWEIVDLAAERFFAAARPIVASDLVTTEKLSRLMAAHVKVITDNLDAAAIYSTEWRHLGDDRRRTFAARRDEYEGIVRDLVLGCIHEGHFAAVDEKFATLLILSSINWIYQWYRPDGPMTPEEIARKLTDMLFNGLKRAGR